MHNLIKPHDDFIKNLAQYRNLLSQLFEEIQWIYPDLNSICVTTYDSEYKFCNYSSSISYDYNLITSGLWKNDRTINWQKPYDSICWNQLDDKIYNIRLPQNENINGMSYMFKNEQNKPWLLHLTYNSQISLETLDESVIKNLGLYILENLFLQFR
jgi:hypothetical protein